MSRALHIRVNNDGTGPSVTPIYQCSAFSAESNYFYSRKDNPNVAELEEVLRTLEGARHALAVTCGMTAIYMALELVRPGDSVVINQDVYGCTFKLFQRLSVRRGWEVRVLDLARPEGIAAIPARTRMVFFETPTNPFLKTIRIADVAERARETEGECLVVVDNTWATPLFQHPLEQGADISLHSGTKYLGGHSDVMNGVILTDRDDLDAELRQTRFYGGMVLSPESAWLVRRSLQTFALRLRHQQETAREMRDFLAGLPEVAEVYYPEVDGEQMTGYGGIVFFRLRGDLVPRYREFSRALKLFGTGTGMACVTSMVAQPYNGSHASMDAAEKAAIGLGEDLVRLCFGLEEPRALQRDLLQALRSAAG